MLVSEIVSFLQNLNQDSEVNVRLDTSWFDINDIIEFDDETVLISIDLK